MHTHFHEIILKAKPNPSHTIFSHLHQRNQLSCIVTQNIDRLHHTAGVPKEKIIELHGNEAEVICMNCKHLYSRDFIHTRILNGEKNPRCGFCSGILKPNTVSFGQRLSEDDLQKATKAIEECDLLLVMGTSLVVAPANKLPSIALQRKIPVVLINQGATQYDKYVNLLIDAPCGKVMQEIQDIL